MNEKRQAKKRSANPAKVAVVPMNADISTREITACPLSIRAATVDEKARTVEAVLATESPVPVYDYSSYKVIDEILVAEGGEVPRSMPMLESHFRWGLDAVLGSLRSPRREDGKWIVTLHFAEGDDKAERAWNKVRQGHLTDISVGYRALEYTDIPAGESKKIGSRLYEAKDRTLRVTTKWRAFEGSLVVIGADQLAKIRAEHINNQSGQHRSRYRESGTMHEKLRAFLESIGLRADASDAEAWAFYGALNGNQRSQADEIISSSLSEDGNHGDSKRQAPEPNNLGKTPASSAPSPSVDNAEAAAAAERARMASIMDLADDDTPQELVQRALYGDPAQNLKPMSVEEFARAALEHRRRQYRPPVQSQAPAAHTRRASADERARAMAAGLILRRLDVRNIPVKDVSDPDQVERLRERAANDSIRYQRMSIREFMREALVLEGRDIPYDDEEFKRAALSTATLQYIFTTSVYASVQAGYEAAPDTTRLWCEEGEVANFQVHTDLRRSRVDGMARLPRGGTAESITFTDEGEDYKAFRFAEMVLIDDQDIEDDRFEMLTELPFDMAEDAAQVRPDLVYSLLLKNPTLKSTGKPLFHVDLLNKGSATLDKTGLQNGITSMAKQRDGKRNLNIKPEFLLIPQDQLFTSRELIESTTIVISGDTDRTQGSKNTLQGLLQPIADNRLGTAGVVDPITGKHYAGSATNWFLAARRRTVKVVYRRGTNRAPVIRPFVLDQGRFGMGWDIHLDIGAYVRDYRGLYKGND